MSLRRPVTVAALWLLEVRDQYVNAAAPPASTLVEVRHLFRDDILLEVEAIAAVRP